MPIVKAGKIKYDEVDPKARVLAELGDIEGVEVFNNKVLVAVYQRPEKTRGGIIVNTDEDKWQSKVGLVVAMGSIAFDDPAGKWFNGVEIKLHDWVTFKPSDGQERNYNDFRCRLFNDTAIDGRVASPDLIW